MQIWEHSVQIGRISIKMTFFCVITRIKLETWNLVNLQIKILQKTFKASRNKIFFASFYCDFNEFFIFFSFYCNFDDSYPAEFTPYVVLSKIFVEKLCQLFLVPLQRFVSLKHIRKPFAGEQEVLRNPLLFYSKGWKMKISKKTHIGSPRI